MKLKFPGRNLVFKNRNHSPSGFALVITLTLMVLLTLLAVGILSLATISLRTSTASEAVSRARANARMAMLIAIGELQKEMGPDMRVSAKAAIFDEQPDSEEIDGVSQPQWLASYESWGNWLNARYKNPSTGKDLTIQDTYEAKRGTMFRRWLLSLPEGMAKDVNAPMNATGWDNTNSVVLVGENSTGVADQDTRAYLNRVGDSGRSAWWISPENQKARIDMAKQPRNLTTASAWEVVQSDTAEVGVGALPDLTVLGADTAVGLGDKLLTAQTLRLAEVDEKIVQKNFFDLTEMSRGVLTSVRTGQLKKDLSLLFEQDKDDLPENYRFDNSDVREPSIRPMSPEIADRAVLKNRHFASWTRMRHFYRMYRQDSDALAPRVVVPSPSGGGTNGSPGLFWDGGKPVADCNVSCYQQPNQNTPIKPAWDNEDSYIRFPILTSTTFILSLKAEKPNAASPFNLYCLSTPVCVFWNPYNVELRLPNSRLWTDIDLVTVQPMLSRVIKNSISGNGKLLHSTQNSGGLQDGSGDFIIFKPGEFRVFTASPGFGTNPREGYFEPGFNATKVGGTQYILGTSSGSADNSKLGINFTPVVGGGGNIGFNSHFGNTPGSFCTMMRWSEHPDGFSTNTMPFHNHIDWLNTSDGQAFAPITRPGKEPGWFDGGLNGQLWPVGFIQLALKSNFSSKNAGWYDSIGWAQDWRCRNWIQAPPFHLGKGLYINNDDATIADTQRLDCPYEFRFGSLSGRLLGDIIPHDPIRNSAFLSVEENVNAIPALELPTAPIGSIAGFSGMRIEPGWTDLKTINPAWEYKRQWNGVINDTTGNTNTFGATKVLAYQSGITGPGIGNSFLHPMIPSTDVYRKLENSIAQEPKKYQFFKDTELLYPYKYDDYSATNTMAYCDYWDHVLLLNDALWDDYFVSSLADQKSRGETARASLADNLKKLSKGEELANSRYKPYLNGRTANDVKDELDNAEGYLKAAKYLIVDGMFNVNSTSVAAWHALFAGIRERKVVYRDKNGALKTIVPPTGKIVLSRFNTADSDQETTDPEEGINRDDGMMAWSGVRFLDNDQLRTLAEKCVEQVKRRGPFLNFSEFINRRLTDNKLGTMGALQSAIDYDDANPDSKSINYNFKSIDDFMIKDFTGVLHDYKTPDAALGSRYAGIPGYVIQSDLLKPIANTLSVRDDTFRIRAYGDAVDKSNKILAQAWCEVIVQRVPEYSEESNQPEVPARTMNSNGEFSDIANSALTPINRAFGRKFRIESFRWLSKSEI